MVNHRYRSTADGKTKAHVRLSLRRRELDNVKPFGNAYTWQHLKNYRSEKISSKLDSLYRAPKEC